MQLVAVTAVGRDRPGIVAEFTGALYRIGCNLEETTMTRLRSEFAMLLLVRLPEGANIGTLTGALSSQAASMDLSLAIRPIEAGEPAGPAPPADEAYILRVYGADKPGIVHAVTRLLADRALNITDLNTRVIAGDRGPVYVMLLEVDVPSPAEAEALRPELERLRQELSVDLAFSAVEPEAL